MRDGRAYSGPFRAKEKTDVAELCGFSVFAFTAAEKFRIRRGSGQGQ
jgi:hypothetical protein